MQEEQRLTMEAALRSYVTFHEMNNASPDTLNNYRYQLPPFVSWLASKGVTYVDELTLQHLREYVVYVQKLPSRNGGSLSDTTIQQYAKHIKAFCRWLEQEDILEKPITPKFKIPRAEKKLITALTPEDVETLLRACEEGDNRKPRLKKALAARNRAIVLVSVDTGLRRKELVGLRLCDINPALSVLTVHRKMNSWQ